MSKLVAVVGAMGAGKTKKLVETFNKLSETGRTVSVFKHTMDVKRDGQRSNVTARDGSSVPATVISTLSEIMDYEPSSGFDVILIDEIQFFDDEYTLEVVEELVTNGVEIHVFGLDLNSDFESFGLMGEILALADEVKKIKCKCHICKSPARVSMFLKGKKDSEIQVGGLEDYKPTCRSCFYMMKNIEEDMEKQTIRSVILRTKDMEVELMISDEDLQKAGYTIEDIRDINSTVGMTNLLKDIGAGELLDDG